MPALALIRSGGMLFVRAANEGRTVIDMFPREKISSDFDTLAAAEPALGRLILSDLGRIVAMRVRRLTEMVIGE